MILVITDEKYPEGDAGAVRIHAFAKLYQSIGYDVTVWGMGPTTDFAEKIYDHVKYRSLRYPSTAYFYRALGRFFYKRNMVKLCKTLRLSELEGIMVYLNGGNGVISYLKKLSRKHGIPLYYNCVEWYSPGEFSKGRLSSTYRRHNRQNEKQIAQGEHAISISRYFHEYFEGKSIHSIRIPVILDVEAMTPKEPGAASGTVAEPTRIVYVGSPGKKDKLCEMIHAFERLNEAEIDRLRLDIVGINAEQYQGLFGEIQPGLLGVSIFFHGRLPRAEAIEHLKRADFAYLLRPAEERYAKAGFPTKVVESLSSGVPMVCNLSSDLSLYLKDMDNSVIVKACSSEACYEALQRILTLSRDDLNRMSAQARQTALTYFDWRVYQDDFKKFTDETVVKKA